MMTMKNIRKRLLGRLLLTMIFLNLPLVLSLPNYILPSPRGGVGGGAAGYLHAQEVIVTVTPVQGVLPPQAGEYFDNPGKFFTVKLVNTTDEPQFVHMGMHVDMLYPDQEVMMATPSNGHIPREPIMLAPQQSKLLNPIEMKNLFRHFSIDELGIRADLFNEGQEGVYGLLPEGQYEMYMQAYKWNPELTQTVELSKPDDGRCLFSICYKAQAPQILTPVVSSFDDDALSQLSVAKLDLNQNVHTITWTMPTLACQSALVSFKYDIKFVKLGDLMPDEAIANNPVEYQMTNLSTTTFTIPSHYYNIWKKDTTMVLAMQLTAHSLINNKANDLNFSLIENDGKSDILLFRFHDPNYVPEGIIDGDMSSEDGESKTDNDGPDYIFEQPTLTKPQFSEKFARKVYVGDSIPVAWREAWFAGGKGEKKDTVKFEYTLNLYKGNSADTPEAIFAGTPVYSNTVTALKDTIKWDKLKGKVQTGDYLMLRVTAKAKNVVDSLIVMKDDSLNYKDFALTEHFDETYACGTNTSFVENKTLIEKVPAKDTKLRINEWILELNDDVKIDKEEHTLAGTGWVRWNPGVFKTRVAVKFENLKVNTDNVVIDGKCVTYPEDKNNSNSEYTSEEALSALFSDFGLDNVWGDLSLPESVKNKVSDAVGGEAVSLAEQYDLGKYYTYFKQGQSVWDNLKNGEPFDFHCPTSLPDDVASMLPDDVSMQIASMQFSPQGAVMDLIGEFVLPKTDVLDNELLIFGIPRMCMEPDRILPEDGTLALLSNFTIKDPDSSYRMTFKAPTDPLHATDGCFIRWEDDEYAGLSIDIAMTIPNLKRVVDGKAIDEPPLLELHGIIEDNWGDWMARAHMDPFEVEDLPGWYFSPGKDIIVDHSYDANYQGQSIHFPDIAQMPTTYDPSKVNAYTKRDWNAWQGVYVDEVSVQFPKWAVFGSEKEGLKIAGQKMFFDNSGVTCDIAALNILNAKTGKAGGWEFDLDMAKVMITQNNFDSCHIEGRFAVPLFGEKDANDPNKGKIRFTCDIRHLTEGETTYYTYDKEGKPEAHKKKTYGENARMAYIFKTQQIDSLNFSCFESDVKPIREQTYLIVAAEDKEDGKTTTYVEMNVAGQINICDKNSTVNTVRQYARKLPLNMDFMGIHFAKMRLANFSYDDMTKVYDEIGSYYNDSLGVKRLESEKKWESEHSGRWIAFKNKEHKLSEALFLDLGEWSLSSPKKKLGPFSVELKQFKPDFNASEKKLSLGIEGAIGFCDDKVTAAVGIDISTKLTIPSDYTNISGYSLSDGTVDFRSVELNADLGMLSLKGRLDVVDDDDHGKGYGGTLGLEVKELFTVDVKGGYYSKEASEEEKKLMGDEPDKEYAWGFFMADMEMDAKTSPLRFDPLVITKLAGGFFFNALPTYDDKTKKFGDPVGKYGPVGISFGLGLSATSGEETLNGDMSLNVIYDRANHRLTTFCLKGGVKAVSGIVSGNMQLLYQNDDQDRFLSLDITAEGGFDNGLGDKIASLNEHLSKEKEQLDEFQKNLDEKVKAFKSDPMGSLASLNSDYENTTTESDSKKNDENTTEKGDAENDSAIAAHKLSDDEKKKAKAGEFKVSLQMLITWRKEGVDYSNPKWHLYLGQPDKDNRCKIVLIDFKSKIVSVDIGADAYLCLGNELPNNGQLPPIPSDITEFLNGGNGKVNTNADLSKAENSRLAAVRAMLGNVNGGVMVGASAWGYINVDLGLFYASLKALAGFDMALVNYKDNAYCANIKRQMGHHGWYATGQFYAYLAAKFGLHIKLGSFINKRINILDAGIGGVFDCGLPSPTWIEGRARVKMVLLDGLVKINKKFEFECGDRCVPFKGNALDDFNLFDECTLGSSDYEQGWADGNGITVGEAVGRAQFTTTAALNSQYRLVDPTTLSDLASRSSQPDSLLQIHAARTYVFNLDEDKNGNYGIKGVRLFKIPMTSSSHKGYQGVMHTIRNNPSTRAILNYVPSSDQSLKMKTKNIGSVVLNQSQTDQVAYRLDNEFRKYEVKVGVREKQGLKYHLQNLSLEPDSYYMLVLGGTAFEVNNGQKQWCEIVENGNNLTYQKWIQYKFFFFHTTGTSEVTDSLKDLTPYVALAYPSAEDGKLFNDEYDNAEAYDLDLTHPTIALREDIRDSEFTQHGKLVWKLQSRVRGKETFAKTESYENVFRTSADGHCINMEPATPFTLYRNSSASAPVVHNLQLVYVQPMYTNELYEWMHNTTVKELPLLPNSYNAWYGIGNGNQNLVERFSIDTNYASYKDNFDLGRAIYDWLTGRRVDFDKLDITFPLNERILADMWFREADRISWQGISPRNGGDRLGGVAGFTDPLPYEQPFIGVRPSKEPTIALGTVPTYTSDPYTSETGFQYEKADGKRLMDPYYFFSYLSNWVFIGGRKTYAYDFDQVATPHATETLTFSYNGMDVSASSQVTGLRTKDAMRVLRDSMYGVWNNWNYNDANQPLYPLPTRLGTNYDRTMANQDGKVSIWYTPWNKNDANSQYDYGLADYLQNFTAPYFVAEALSTKLYDIFNELWHIYTTYLVGEKGSDSKFKPKMQEWSNRHRGQYLTIQSQGYEVRVPYYQFPLIFGNMFGDGAYDPAYNKSQVSQGRTFNKSFGGNNVMKATWLSYVQNLFVWRILGGFPWKTNKYFTYAQLTDDKGKKRDYIYRESFNAETALKNVKTLTAYVYRVNSFDRTTGQYTVGQMGASSVETIGGWYTARTITIDNDIYARLNGLGRPGVQVNGSSFKPSTKGNYGYVDMTIAPEMPTEKPEGSSTTTSTLNGKTTGPTATGGSTKPGSTIANELGYQLLVQNLQSSTNKGYQYYLKIKSQDASLAAQMLSRLAEEYPDLYAALSVRIGANSTTATRTTTGNSLNKKKK